jgi:hypothetical protein
MYCRQNIASTITGRFSLSFSLSDPVTFIPEGDAHTPSEDPHCCSKILITSSLLNGSGPTTDCLRYVTITVKAQHALSEFMIGKAWLAIQFINSNQSATFVI